MSWSWLSNRTPGYQIIADRLGLHFSELDDQKVLYQRHLQFKVFKIGSWRKIKYILQGVTGRNELFYSFEYFYTVSTGKTTVTYIQNIYSVFLNANIPTFYIRPQNAFHRIGKWFGMQDIEFDTYDDFNKNYMVKAESEVNFRKFFNTEILGYLSFEKGWSIQSDGAQVIFFKEHKRMNEEMVEPFLQVANTLFSLLMNYNSIGTGISSLDKPKPNK
ncbi:MAG: hypothetical protein ABI844_15580 [Saprospiraceae bacterium]